MSEHAPQPDADAAFEIAKGIWEKTWPDDWPPSDALEGFETGWNAARAHEAERRRELRYIVPQQDFIDWWASINPGDLNPQAAIAVWDAAIIAAEARLAQSEEAL